MLRTMVTILVAIGSWRLLNSFTALRVALLLGLLRLWRVLVGRRFIWAVCTLLVMARLCLRVLGLPFRGLRVLPRVRWVLNNSSVGWCGKLVG